jgi:N-acetylglucosaminyl-diphospho-decaprenol L-rhamnosyltransferase
MKICAIVLDYRGAARTEECLRSLRNQGLESVLVVDNSANSNASADLDEAIARLGTSGTDYALHVLRPAANLGFGGGVNFALKDAATQDCEAVLLINNDATATPAMVSRLSIALSDGRLDMVAPTIIDGSGNVQPIFWYQRFLGLLSARPLPFSFPYLSGCCIIFRRAMLTSNKLFDEDFFMYGEDTFLGWQMDRTGKTARCVHDAVVRHSGNGSSQKCKMFYEYHSARAHVLLALKTWRHPLEVPLMVGGKIFGLLMRAARRCVRYKNGLPLLAFLLAWFPLDIRAP